MSAALIQNVISRKQEQQPQFDFLFRVELPSLAAGVDSSSSGIVQAYSGNSRLNNVPGIGGLISQAAGALSNANQVINNAINSGISAANGIFSQIGLNVNVSSPLQIPGGLASMDHISHRVYEISTPYKSYNIENAIYKSRNKKLASRRDVSNLSMSIDEMEDGLSLAYLFAWQALIENPDGTHNPPVFYKHPIRFINMSATKLDLTVVEYSGCFPSEISPVSRTYDGNGVAQFSVTFAVDDIKIIPSMNAMAAIQAEENDILMREYRMSGFNLSNFDLNKQAAILGRISQIVF